MTTSLTLKNPELNIAICEDNPAHLSQCHEILRRNAGNTAPLFSLYACGEDLLADMERGREFDVLFLDIEMQGKDGIETGKAVRRHNKNIVLVYLTAYRQYAIKAYETRAFRYLLKPLDEDSARDIMAAVKRECRQYQKLVFKEWDTVHFVNIADIVYLEAKNKYTFAYTLSQEFSSKTSLNEYESLLTPNGFFRIHRKYLINCFYVKALTPAGLTLSNGILLPVARSQRSNVKKLFYDAMERGIF
ncbi:MAG: LytTR family DNA-binding domain-containing protein [Roseburia sp.]|nr:LytTR family DNA-binding domain-containing protein [Roseburia sp.]